jgi:DNA-binding XRE family transcriptional regulator
VIVGFRNQDFLLSCSSKGGNKMMITIPFVLGGFLIYLAMGAALIFLLVLVIRALLKYTRSDSVRKEKARITRSLGETLKENRTRCKMTQEFVAESIGVSRQAVSKWESGTSDPSTSNLLALAKLYGISAEELLKSVE